MYMKPTFPAAGALCDIQAPAHANALASMHIGSGPGVAGESGMQVQPLWPFRSVRILPAAPIATMVASFATAAGAARSALAIKLASPGAFVIASSPPPRINANIRAECLPNKAVLFIRASRRLFPLYVRGRAARLPAPLASGGSYAGVRPRVSAAPAQGRAGGLGRPRKVKAQRRCAEE